MGLGRRTRWLAVQDPLRRRGACGRREAVAGLGRARARGHHAAGAALQAGREEEVQGLEVGAHLPRPPHPRRRRGGPPLRLRRRHARAAPRRRLHTRSQLRDELDALTFSGMFDHVTFQTKPKPDGTLGLTVSYAETEWPAVEQFKFINVGDLMAQPDNDELELEDDMTARERMDYLRRQEREYQQLVRRAKPCILPETLQRELQGMVKKQRKVSSGLLNRMAGRIERWYHDEGFQCAQAVSYHGNLDTGEVVEGDITKVEYLFLDKLYVVDGNTSIPVIDRELPHQLRPGHIYNYGARKQALKNIDSLGLFSTVEVQPRPDETNQGGVIVAIKLKEHDPKSAQVITDWSIVPGSQGRPTLASIQPGGTVSFEHHNICDLKRSLIGSVTSSNLLNPEDDLLFKLEYAHPCLDGVEDHGRNRTFKISCFNSRKLSPIFVAGPHMYEAPPIWVDRIGFKANITVVCTIDITFHSF